MSDWIEAAELAKVLPGVPLAVYPKGVNVLLIRVDDDVFAMANTCAHMACPLEGGKLEGFEITCPCHDWRFDVRSGVFADAPEISVPVYPVKVDAGTVSVSLSGAGS